MDEVIQEFVCETKEKLDLLDQELIKLEQIPLDHEVVDNIFRMLHTIKGTSGFIGLEHLGRIAHVSENILSAIRDERLSPAPEVINAVLKALDVIKEIVAHLDEFKQEPERDDSILIAILDRFLDPHVQAAANTLADSNAPQTILQDIPDLQISLDIDLKQEKKNVSSTKNEDTESSQHETFQENNLKRTGRDFDTDLKSTENKKNNQVQSIRVNIDTLEDLMQVVSELVLIRNQLTQLIRTNTEAQAIFQSPLQQLSYITTEIQEKMMKTRMQPIGNAWTQLPRLVRNLSLDLQKKIELRMFGEDTELDRQLLEIIKDPLTHMVRNSCDHGIEKPEERFEAGKPETGVIKLSSYHEGGHIIIKVEDDGRGINLEKIKKKLLENNILTQYALDTMNPKSIMQFIFHPGFSTAETVTNVSGRGVGMDVVRTNIEKMGGTVELLSEQGKGSQFLIKIPLTLAIISVLIVETHNQKFAFPQLNVQEVLIISEEAEYAIETLEKSQMLRLRGQLLPLVSLPKILGLPHEQSPGDTLQVVVCKTGAQEFGLIVDRVHGTEEIVVKPVTYLMKDLPLFSGNTILGDGSVIMILDPGGIVKEALSSAVHEGMGVEHNTNYATEEPSVGFLIFHDMYGTTKAIPLELVSRIEKVEVKKIEPSSDGLVMQYRDELMRIFPFDPAFTLPTEGEVNVVVFVHNDCCIGVIVHEIVDITYESYDIKLGSEQSQYIGSMVIHGISTDIVDVSAMLEQYMPSKQKNSLASSATSEKPYKILIVEDNPLFRNLTEQLLTSYGYEVFKTEHGAEAMQIIEQQPSLFDLIITDIDMPVMNGFEFLKQYRACFPFKKTPIIAYTGFLENILPHHLENNGFDACISKSDRSGLLNAIAKQLDKQASTPDDDFGIFDDPEEDDIEAKNMKILSVRLENYHFGLHVDCVRDVLNEYHLTEIPELSKNIKSFINLRGRVVTVLDLNYILQFEQSVEAPKMLVVVEHNDEFFGLLVNEVDEVLTIDKENLEPAPINLSEQWRDVLSGVCQLEKKLLAILDVNTFFEKLS